MGAFCSVKWHGYAWLYIILRYTGTALERKYEPIKRHSCFVYFFLHFKALSVKNLQNSNICTRNSNKENGRCVFMCECTKGRGKERETEKEK